jgi:hypothetical protein
MSSLREKKPKEIKKYGYKFSTMKDYVLEQGFDL